MSSARKASQRLQGNAQQRQVLTEIWETPKPEIWSLDHTVSGALDADKAHIAELIERAERGLADPLYMLFLEQLSSHVDKLAADYHSPKGAREALQAHVEKSLKRFHGKK
ncbi:hypothetical protein [Nocardiopsis synnemataformans]|uniref:hypothetical protein n=1 Tax=Nocardiopsis synnemataformans TaxID=61305 RepID=UPI003EBA411C